MSLINTKDRIFIAGASGMVGQSIYKNLKENKYTNLLIPSRKELDLCNYSEVNNWFNKFKPSVVIIAAAKVGGIAANFKFPFEFLLDNLKIQNNIMEIAFKCNVKRLLFLGSSCIYPKESKQPIKEEYLMSNYLEKTNESYAIAKIAGLKLCEALRTQHRFDAISVMPTNLYGSGDNYHPELSHVLPGLIRRISYSKKYSQSSVTCWGDGTPKREFLHVDDLAKACIFLLEKWNPSSKNSPKDNEGNILNHLNIGSGEEVSIKELAILIAEILDYKGHILWDKTKPNGTFRKKLDSTRIQSLGWNSKINLRTGLEKTIWEFNSIYYENL